MHLYLQGFLHVVDFYGLLDRMGQGYQSGTDIMLNLDDLSAMRKVHAAPDAVVVCARLLRCILLVSLHFSAIILSFAGQSGHRWQSEW